MGNNYGQCTSQCIILYSIQNVPGHQNIVTVVFCFVVVVTFLCVTAPSDHLIELCF